VSDLVAFLRARLNEAEARAKFAVSLSHGDDPDWHEWYEWGWHSEYREGGSGSMFLPGCPSPAQVLREVEAKRRIIDLDGDWPYGAEMEAGEAVTGWSDAIDRVLRLLALPYSDHPDYDPAWATD
jgi:hypothetical protein